jgi:hypothetical protein
LDVEIEFNPPTLLNLPWRGFSAFPALDDVKVRGMGAFLKPILAILRNASYGFVGIGLIFIYYMN